MWKVYLFGFVIVVIIGLLWANGISTMYKKHPDYKGKGEGFNLEDENDKKE